MNKSATGVPEGCDDYNVEALHEGLADAEKGAPLSFPAPLVILFAIAAFLAGAYLISLGSGGGAAGAGGPVVEKTKGPMELGGQLFKRNCAACHQGTGLGLPGQYPPLAGSEFVIHGDKRPILIVLYGLHGPVTVKGGAYNGNMQNWSGSFTDAQIADLVTYIRGSWGNTANAVAEEQVAAMRTEFDGHAQFTADQILAIPQDENVPGAPAPTQAAAK